MIESTAFENTAANVKVFLQNVHAAYGMGDEAIEAFLQYVNKI